MAAPVFSLGIAAVPAMPLHPPSKYFAAFTTFRTPAYRPVVTNPAPPLTPAPTRSPCMQARPHDRRPAFTVLLLDAAALMLPLAAVAFAAASLAACAATAFASRHGDEGSQQSADLQRSGVT
jgi:hypothetical protein